MLLRTRGAEVANAGGAAHALSMVDTAQVVMIVCDIVMAGRDGYALLESLKKSKAHMVPVIALTDFARTDDRRRALAAGFAERMGKPLQLDAFFRATSTATAATASKIRNRVIARNGSRRSMLLFI